jgi:septum formation protein
MKNIILASSSPRRLELLSRTGIKFGVDPGDYEEVHDPSLNAEQLVRKLSFEKAQNVAGKHIDAIVIGADTVISLEGEVFGKPHTPEKARKTLHALSGRYHDVLTGITIMTSDNWNMRADIERTRVYFRALTGEEIDAYIATGEPLQKAGAYAIQGGARKFVERFEGDYSNILGFPLTLLRRMLREFEVELPEADVYL